MGDVQDSQVVKSEEGQTEHLVDLIPIASTIQDVLSRSYGIGFDTGRDSSADPAQSVASASVERLREAGKGRQRYKLKGEIGRGGMGAVLRIVDSDLRRELAMKVILGRGGKAEASTASVQPRQVLRFLEEAQITGQLDHPGVVPVHELGVDGEGRVYFTMRLIKGENLAAVYARVHGEDENWNLTRALGVILKVCEAMSYAHEKGVIHRDLKPSNIMVGDHGAVYVMDWGLARAADGDSDLRFSDQSEPASHVQTDRRDAKDELEASALLTVEGSVLGSPCYMPPEQAAGKLDEIGPHSDVYALGAMLYHLLTGRMPYLSPGHSASTPLILDLVLKGPPQAIQDLAEDVAPELVAIAEKAMQRDPSERYPNMGEVAEDLRAYLENRVVQAHRTGAIVELKKWIQRNRALAAMILAFVVLSVGGSSTAAVVLGAKNETIRQARDEALSARDSADLAAAMEIKQREQAEKAREASEGVTNFLASQLQALEPETTRGRPLMVREFLENAASSLEEQMTNSPLEAARLRKVLGEAFSSLGLLDQAEPLLERARSDRIGLLGEDSREAIDSSTDLAILWARQGKLRAAETLATATLEKSRSLLGENHVETLVALSALALVYSGQGRHTETANLLTSLLEKTELVFGEQSSQAYVVMNNLASTFMEQGRYDEAEEYYLVLYDEQCAALGEDHPNSLAMANNLASLYRLQGRYGESEALFKKTLDLTRSVLTDEHPRTLDALNDLATVYLSQRQFAKAEPICKEAYEKRRAVLGANHPDTLTSMTNLGGLYESLGRLEEAEELLEGALDGRLESLNENHPDIPASMNNLASLYQSQGRYKEAEELYLLAIEKRTKLLGPTHTATLTSINNLATLYLDQGRLPEAEKRFRQSLEGWRAEFGDKHPSVAACLRSMGVVNRDAGRYSEAEAFYSEATRVLANLLGEDDPNTLAAQSDHRQLLEDWLRRLTENLGEDDPQTLIVLRKLALLTAHDPNSEKAEELLFLCIDKRMEALGESDPATLESLQDLASFYARGNRLDEAEALLRECFEQRTAIQGKSHGATLATLEELVRLLAQQKRWNEALPLARQLLQDTPSDGESIGNRKRLLGEIQSQED